jgi:ribosomal protein S27E
MAMEVSITEITPKPRKPRGRPIGERKVNARPKRDYVAERARRAELAEARGAWRFKAVRCPACGHTGMVSNSLDPTREITCSRCATSAVFCCAVAEAG